MVDDDYRNNHTDRDDSNDHEAIFDIDGDDTDYSEETAAEAAPLEGMNRAQDRENVDEGDRGGMQSQNGVGYGILALVLSIVAFFFLPVVMGAAGIIIGFVARSKGAGAWGGWAIGIGIAALAIRLFAAPFF